MLEREIPACLKGPCHIESSVLHLPHLVFGHQRLLRLVIKVIHNGGGEPLRAVLLEQPAEVVSGPPLEPILWFGMAIVSPIVSAVWLIANPPSYPSLLAIVIRVDLA